MDRDIPQRYQKLYRTAMAGRSQRAAIRSFCLECVAYQFDEVRACPDHGCPLHAYRLTGRKCPADANSPHGISPSRAGLQFGGQTAPKTV